MKQIAALLLLMCLSSTPAFAKWPPSPYEFYLQEQRQWDRDKVSRQLRELQFELEMQRIQLQEQLRDQEQQRIINQMIWGCPRY